MTVHRVQVLYTQKAKFYQRFFVRFLQWEKVLDTFFEANNFLGPGMKILDAGCGTGPVTKALYRHSRQQGLENIAFYGFDLTPAMLDLFQQWIEEEGAHEIQIRQADVLSLENQLPSDWNGFDWVVSSAMLDYIPEENRQKALRNLRGLLNENGHLLLIVTKRTWITQWTGAKWWGTNLFDPDAFAGELRQAGFVTVQFKKLPGSWDAFLMAAEARTSDRKNPFPRH